MCYKPPSYSFFCIFLFYANTHAKSPEFMDHNPPQAPSARFLTLLDDIDFDVPDEVSGSPPLEGPRIDMALLINPPIIPSPTVPPPPTNTPVSDIIQEEICIGSSCYTFNIPTHIVNDIDLYQEFINEAIIYVEDYIDQHNIFQFTFIFRQEFIPATREQFDA